MRLCWLIGHSEVFNDGGYPICSCGSSAYWNQDDVLWNKGGLIYRPIYFIRKLIWNGKEWMQKWFRKCGDCHNFEVFLGREVGDHHDCVPF
jgi:hypothetical protein